MGSPIEVHAEVLAGLDYDIRVAEPVDSPDGRRVAALAGRRRIVERHAPFIAVHEGAVCQPGTHYDDPAPWPCEDYRDAAADLLPDVDDAG